MIDPCASISTSFRPIACCPAPKSLQISAPLLHKLSVKSQRIGTSQDAVVRFNLSFFLFGLFRCSDVIVSYRLISVLFASCIVLHELNCLLAKQPDSQWLTPRRLLLPIALITMSRSTIASTIGLGCLLANPVAGLAGWWTWSPDTLTPHFAYQDPGSGDILHSSCNSNGSAAFLSDKPNKFPIKAQPKPATPLAVTGWWDDDLNTPIVSILRLNFDGLGINIAGFHLLPGYRRLDRECVLYMRQQDG
jgi:hypothetical protein